ncbi:putative tail fiber protein [Caudoviricetes sp.]|nr:putative tail fiber protein [Caudoviricetes sp.]
MTTVIGGSSPSVTFSDGTTQTTAFSSSSAVTSLASGTGVSVSGSTGGVTVTNTGVTSVDSTTGAVTLSSLASFAKSLATSGYQKLPGGLIIQWGVSGTITNGGTTTVTWPIAFTTACLFATWGQQSSSHGSTTCIVYSWTTTGATMYQGSGSNIAGYYIAIGF